MSCSIVSSKRNPIKPVLCFCCFLFAISCHFLACMQGKKGMRVLFESKSMKKARLPEQEGGHSVIPCESHQTILRNKNLSIVIYIYILNIFAWIWWKRACSTAISCCYVTMLAMQNHQKHQIRLDPNRADLRQNFNSRKLYLFKSKELHLNGSVFHLNCRLVGLGQPAQDASHHLIFLGSGIPVNLHCHS